MRVLNQRIRLSTKGSGDMVDITQKLSEALASSGLRIGSLSVFAVGSTLAITAFEYEPGLIEDVRDLYERLAPSEKRYAHDETWGDANGFSHLRSAIQGQSMTIPFEDGRLLLGTWQQVVLAEFDTRARQRELVVQLIGE